LVNRFEKSFKSSEIGFTAYYIDTSQSNLKHRDVDSDRVHVFAGKDGGGQIRSNTHSTVAPRMDAVLSKMKPGLFNIVVCSASGGTGAVAAQAIVYELMQEKKMVLMIVVGSTESKQTVENTLKTIGSLEQMAAKKVNKPVAVHYLENSAISKRASVDENVIGALSLLVGLFSGQHDELDSEDLRTWLSHPSLGQRVVDIQFGNSADTYAACTSPLSVATLAKPGADTSLSPIPAYQAVGFVPAGWYEGKNPLMTGETLHYIIGDDVILSTARRLKETQDVASDEVNARGRRDSFLGDTTASDEDSGIIL
jgi:hypothetical protein